MSLAFVFTTNAEAEERKIQQLNLPHKKPCTQKSHMRLSGQQTLPNDCAEAWIRGVENGEPSHEVTPTPPHHDDEASLYGEEDLEGLPGFDPI